MKRLPSESDWEQNSAMSDEEIEAAIASDPGEADLGEGWMEHGAVSVKGKVTKKRI